MTIKVKNNYNKVFIYLIPIMIIGLIFRLVKLKHFQYWSDDEQLFWYVMRHIAVDKHPSLTQPNTATGLGLGTLFHIPAAIWSKIWGMNPEEIGLLGILFSFINTLALYFAGKNIGGSKTGIVASLLYSLSFIGAIFDHRLWALTPSIFLISLAIIALSKSLDGQTKYFPLIAIPAGFTFNSDPSLGIVFVVLVLFFAVFRSKITKVEIVKSIIIFLAIISPLIIFDLKHKGQNTKSFFSFVNQQIEISDIERTRSGNFLVIQLANFSRYILPTKTPNADSYFCYCYLDDKPIWQTVIFSVILGTFVFSTMKIKDKKDTLMIIFLFSYLLSVLGFREILEGNPAFFYSLVVSPVVYILTAKVISKK